MYKISIILPIFNVEKFLERALKSIINQTMDLKDIEVIMVDDVSTDGSRKIMKEYSNKYSNFISIFHEKNSGGCGFPRNTGLEVASGEYVMFLDPDDEFLPENCEMLYNAIKKYDADVAFGRYKRCFYSLNKYELSPSPFDVFFKNNESNNIIYAEHIKDNFDLLRLPASVWTKIYKKEFLVDNNFKFQQQAAEDVIFVLETFKKARGIVFLNNHIGYVYYTYDAEDSLSMTNNVSFNMLSDLCDSYCKSLFITKDFPKEVRSFQIYPHLMHWFALFGRSDLTNDEKRYLIGKFKKLNSVTNFNFKTRMLFLYIITYIKIIFPIKRFLIKLLNKFKTS